ncbi:MAG: DNA polymerase [bacterium]
MANTLRSCFVACEGHLLVAVDASQIELRELAIESQDPAMLEDLSSGDLHLATAIRMIGFTDDPDEMKRRRYIAKQANFALVYGAEEAKLAEMLDCSEEEAAEWMEEHRRTYPRLYAWMEEKKAEVRELGFTVNRYGRIRQIPELHDSNWRVRERAENEIINTIIQGTAVDTVKLMMIHMRRYLPLTCRLVLQVHDEMVWEVPEQLAYYTASSCWNELREHFPQYPVSIKIGKRYSDSEMEEYTNETLTT